MKNDAWKPVGCSRPLKSLGIRCRQKLATKSTRPAEIGTRERFKSETAAELCALLAFSAIKNNDKVALIIFTDKIEKFVPPKKGRAHVLRLIREILYFKPQGTGTDISGAIQYMTRVIRRKSVVFLISDFLSEGFYKPLQKEEFRVDLDPKNGQAVRTASLAFGLWKVPSSAGHEVAMIRVTL